MSERKNEPAWWVLAEYAKCFREWYPGFNEEDCVGCVLYRIMRKTRCAGQHAKRFPEDVQKIMELIQYTGRAYLESLKEGERWN